MQLPLGTLRSKAWGRGFPGPVPGEIRKLQPEDSSYRQASSSRILAAQKKKAALSL